MDNELKEAIAYYVMIAVVVGILTWAAGCWS